MSAVDLHDECIVLANYFVINDVDINLAQVLMSSYVFNFIKKCGRTHVRRN